VYDPAHYNDRLLLGLKGVMSETELHILKQRMDQGRLSKARRGELAFALPVGYVWGEGGEIRFDPDEQAQEVVRLIFRRFAELGTLGGLLRFLARNNVQVGVRVREGLGKGALVWRRPNRMTLQNMLKHPLYAGTYAYGRRQDDPRRKRPDRPRSGRVVMAPEAWHAAVPDRAPAYITWAAYEQNLARLAANRARATAMGAVRSGRALLAGLVVCARCHCRLGVHYDNGATGAFTYECVSRLNNYGGPRCQHVPGTCLDPFVSQEILTALAPAALELSLTATERLEQERAELDRLWQQRRDRAAYEVERAARQYQLVEPENRLVARTLERAWEEKLTAQQKLDEDYHRFTREQPRVLSGDEREAIRRLAADIPALWDAPTTTPTDRKEIIRQVVERVLVDVQGRSECVQVRIDWVGGGQIAGELTRPVATLADLSTYPQISERVRALTEEGWTASTIAEQLDAEGYRPAHAETRFGADAVRKVRGELGLGAVLLHRRSRHDLGTDEWWPGELARELGIPKGTLSTWLRRGWAKGRRLADAQHRWVIWADPAEQDRLRAYHRRSMSEAMRQPWQTQEESGAPHNKHHPPRERTSDGD
jgi:hypothetical protein